MKVKNKYRNYILGSLCFLMAAFCVSCSEDIPGGKEQSGNSTVTFEVGIDASMMTRATGDYGSVSDYKTTVYIFTKIRDVDAGVPQPDDKNFYEGFTFYESKELNSALFTYNMQEDKLYLFTFIACEKPYAEKGLGKVVYAGDSALEDIAVGTELTKCFVPVFENSFDNSGEGYFKPYPKEPDAKDDFMIFGAAHQINGMAQGNYKPEKITLTRQLGAVVFKAQASTEQVTCKVASDYYRLYLLQMLGENGYSLFNDYASSAMFPLMCKEFSGSADGIYTFYLPCTTIKTPSTFSPDSDGQANCFTTEGWEELVETSITVNGTTYKLDPTVKFPIFPNYKTILTADDGSRLDVSFGGNDGGIDLEDKWNGM